MSIFAMPSDSDFHKGNKSASTFEAQNNNFAQYIAIIGSLCQIWPKLKDKMGKIMKTFKNTF